MSPVKTEFVHPYSRKGRAVSGYRRQRYNTMRLLSGRDVPTCTMPDCGETDMEKLMIAHNSPNRFSGYSVRSGGTRYAAWMQHVRQHPEEYTVLCAVHHGKRDCRVVPAPGVHRRKAAA